MFGVDLTSSGTNTLLFDATQGVGTFFVSRKITVTTAGNYDVTASDVGFPASFANFEVAVTQGTSTLAPSSTMARLRLPQHRVTISSTSLPNPTLSQMPEPTPSTSRIPHRQSSCNPVLPT